MCASATGMAYRLVNKADGWATGWHQTDGFIDFLMQVAALYPDWELEEQGAVTSGQWPVGSDQSLTTDHWPLATALMY